MKREPSIKPEPLIKAEESFIKRPRPASAELSPTKYTSVVTQQLSKALPLPTEDSDAEKDISEDRALGKVVKGVKEAE